MSEKRNNTWHIVLCAALWALTLGWLYEIFYFSGQNAEESAGLSMRVAVFISEKILRGRITAKALHAPLRKLAHFGIFAVEGALLMSALGASMRRRAVPVCMSALACVAMAALNELHETTVKGRSGNFTDVCIDTAGAALGIAFAWLLLTLIFRRIRRRRKKRRRRENLQSGVDKRRQV